MSEDIVDRLRRGITASGGVDLAAETVREAADAIQRLRAEVDGLRARAEAAEEDAEGYSRHPGTWV